MIDSTVTRACEQAFRHVLLGNLTATRDKKPEEISGPLARALRIAMHDILLNYGVRFDDKSLSLSADDQLKKPAKPQRMTCIDKALVALATCQDTSDKERAHSTADTILCELLVSLGCADVVDAYEHVPKWYS